jgi:peroxiredoxin
MRAQQEEAARRRRWAVIWAVTGVLGVALALTLGILASRTSTAPVPSAADPSKANANAPASLVAAADAVGFQPHSEPGTGVVETRSAADAPKPTNPDLLAPGTTAPAFTLKTPEGETVSLSDYRGKALLLEIFATWCPHCQAEAPYLEKISQRLDSSKAAVVSIDGSSGDAASVFAYHRYFGLTFPSLLDPSGTPGSFSQPGPPGPVSTAFKLKSFPTFYVISPAGKVTWASDGEQPTAKLMQEVEKAMNA